MTLRDEERMGMVLIKTIFSGDAEAMRLIHSAWDPEEWQGVAGALAVWHGEAMRKSGLDPVAEMDKMLEKLLHDEAAEE